MNDRQWGCVWYLSCPNTHEATTVDSSPYMQCTRDNPTPLPVATSDNETKLRVALSIKLAIKKFREIFHNLLMSAPYENGLCETPHKQIHNLFYAYVLRKMAAAKRSISSTSLVILQRASS